MSTIQGWNMSLTIFVIKNNINKNCYALIKSILITYLVNICNKIFVHWFNYKKLMNFTSFNDVTLIYTFLLMW